MGRTERWGVFLLLAITHFAIACSSEEIPPPTRRKINSKGDGVQSVSTMSSTQRLFEEGLRAEPHKPIVLEDGDIIKCIKLSNQPSLIGRSSQKIPTAPKDLPIASIGTELSSLDKDATQIFARGNRTCPQGTIPYRKSRESKSPNSSLFINFTHEHAIGNLQEKNRGVQLNLNVWSPYVETHKDFTLAQLWVIAEDGKTNTIEAGWQVFKHKYGDYRPRLFVYWTADGYNQTGCYNLDCPGFVQTSSKVVIGGAVWPTSAQGGTQYSLRMLVYKDLPSNKWWLRVGDDYVGYWPASIFSNSLRNTSDWLEFGGEVFSHKNSQCHTATDMGSGVFPGSGFGRSAYISKIQYVDLHNTLNEATEISLISVRPNFYQAGGDTVSPKSLGVHFFFGGPGRSSNCTCA